MRKGKKVKFMLYNNRQSVCIQTYHQDTSQTATIVCLVIYFHARINSSMRKCKKVKFMLYNNRQSVCIQT